MNDPSHFRYFFKRPAAIAVPVCLALLAPGEILAAGPTVATLLATCDRGFAQGNQGRDAAACEWYAVPCACSSRHASSNTPGWCIPPSEAPEQTVRKVVAELRLYPDPDADAGPVVAAIVAKLYPCRSKRDE